MIIARLSRLVQLPFTTPSELRGWTIDLRASCWNFSLNSKSFEGNFMRTIKYPTIYLFLCELSLIKMLAISLSLKITILECSLAFPPSLTLETESQAFSKTFNDNRKFVTIVRRAAGNAIRWHFEAKGTWIIILCASLSPFASKKNRFCRRIGKRNFNSHINFHPPPCRKPHGETLHFANYLNQWHIFFKRKKASDDLHFKVTRLRRSGFLLCWLVKRHFSSR